MYYNITILYNKCLRSKNIFFPKKRLWGDVVDLWQGGGEGGRRVTGLVSDCLVYFVLQFYNYILFSFIILYFKLLI